jgi:hypothetical protein
MLHQLEELKLTALMNPIKNLIIKPNTKTTTSSEPSLSLLRDLG